MTTDPVWLAGFQAGKEAALNCQPSTAENPNEDACQRARFDAVMEFARAIAALSPGAAGAVPAGHVTIAHDGFSGNIIGYYTTREGKRGVVVQQDGTRVVHVYGEKWIIPPTEET